MMRLAIFLIIFSLNISNLTSGNLFGGDFERSTVSVITKTSFHQFRVEVAKTEEQHRLGLMFRRKLDRDAGMLFIFDIPKILKIWMKNTFIPLDILFIDSQGVIISIKERALPMSLQTISSGEPAVAVLELNGGTVSRLDIKPGDKVRY